MAADQRPHEETPPSGEARAAPDLSDSLNALGEEARAGLKAAKDASEAFRILVSADISLARSAFGRTLAFTGVAIAFGASAWLLLMASLVVWLSRGAGLAWSLSMLLTGVLSVLATVGAGYAAMRYFEHTRMKATRRQLARLGIGELAAFMPEAGSAETAEQAAERVAEANQGGEPIKKGLGVDVTAP